MQVLHQRLKQADTASLAALIFDLIESAKLQPGATQGLGLVHSRLHVFVDLLLEVKAQLVIEFVLCGGMPHQGTQPEE
jgi:hypothetical protein